MQLSFSATKPPMTLRVCRSLLWTQAAVTVLGGIFVVLIGTLFGASNAVPFHDGTVTAAAAVTLGLVYIGVGFVLAWLGVVLGRLTSWALAAIVSMEVFLAVLDLYRSFDLSATTLFNVALYIAVVGFLFAPDTRRALEAGPAG